MFRVNDNYDAGALQKLLLRFRDAARRGIDTVLADEIDEQLLQEHRPSLRKSTAERLSRWCKTNGSPYQAGMPIAREISVLLFGIVLDRDALRT